MNMDNDLSPLTDEEERRFDELFAPADRLTLTFGWEEILRDQVAEERPDDGFETSEGTDAGIVDLSEAAAARASRGRFLVAAAAVLIMGIFGTLAFQGRASTQSDLDSVPLLSPTREVDTPEFRSLDLPANARAASAAASGALLAVSNVQGEPTSTFHVSTDQQNWSDVGSFDVVNPLLDTSTDTWVVLGHQGSEAIQTSWESLNARTLIAYVSADQGATWTDRAIPRDGEDLVDGMGRVHVPSGVAVIDGDVIVAYQQGIMFDLKDIAVERGLASPNDTIINVASSLQPADPQLYSLGPDRPGLIPVPVRDLIDDETASAGSSQFNKVVRLNEDGSTTELMVPGGDRAWELSLFSDGEQVILIEVGSSGRPSVHRLAAGDEWIEESTDGFFFDQKRLSDDWIVRTDGEIGSQSLDGGRSFNTIPSPAAGSVAQAIFKTDFGGTVVWGDVPVYYDFAVAGTVVEKDGYEIELFDNNTYTLRTSEGEVLADRQPEVYREGNASIRDFESNIHVLDADGRRLTTFTVEELSGAAFANSPVMRNPLDLFISWSTDGEDWRFADLTQLGGGVWEFSLAGDTILAVNDPSWEDTSRAATAVIIEWPTATP